MDRREAMKAFAGLVTTTGLSATPVTTHDAQGIELVILKTSGQLSRETCEHIAQYWKNGVTGTALEQTRVIVLSEGIHAEFVRTKA